MKITQLRVFLVEHPLLVLEIGFRPVPDPTQPQGFDVEHTVPGARWLRRWQQHLDNTLLVALLQGTVHDLQAEILVLGEAVARNTYYKYTRAEDAPRPRQPRQPSPVDRRPVPQRW